LLISNHSPPVTPPRNATRTKILFLHTLPSPAPSGRYVFCRQFIPLRASGMGPLTPCMQVLFSFLSLAQIIVSPPFFFFCFFGPREKAYSPSSLGRLISLSVVGCYEEVPTVHHQCRHQFSPHHFAPCAPVLFSSPVWTGTLGLRVVSRCLSLSWSRKNVSPFLFGLTASTILFEFLLWCSSSWFHHLPRFLSPWFRSP